MRQVIGRELACLVAPIRYQRAAEGRDKQIAALLSKLAEGE